MSDDERPESRIPFATDDMLIGDLKALEDGLRDVEAHAGALATRAAAARAQLEPRPTGQAASS